MHLAKFFHTQSGKYIMSVILGFGLATLFRSVCEGKNCIIMKAPPIDEIKNKIYKYQDKCYKFTASSTKCDTTKKIIGF
uniref:Uncharacterized protein n=1 Tax=viral metagenome TaxID=1070528 RepID=A0A6C0B2B4_9ZZZZ